MRDERKALLSGNGKVIHFVGIGGVSMSALAKTLASRGFSVRGSDMNAGVYAERLHALGIKVIKGHAAENADGADVIIRTSAVHDDNPEIIRARELGIPVLERAEAWGILMEEFPEVVCVSGTHGKTSTTAMITCIALAGDRDPEVMIGADMREIGGVVRIADGDLFIGESCEYCNSFHNFYPTVSVILNIEEDHLDFFKDIDDIKDSFAKFMCNTKSGGIIIANGDDGNVLDALVRAGKSATTFGFSENCDIRAENLVYNDGFPMFDIVYKGDVFCSVRLSVLGEHNVKNALAAACVGIRLGVSPQMISRALSEFTGVGRRMEYKGSFRGAKVYDDYAHHPSEIETTLRAVKRAHKGNVVCVFQPHTYTRTAALKDDFAKALSLADKVILADIFAAREKNVNGIDSSLISDKIQGAEFIRAFDDIVSYLENSVTENDFVLTMGAGDIYKVGEKLCEKK